MSVKMKLYLVCLLVLLFAACAAPNDLPGVRVVGGGDAAPGQFTYQASVQYCFLGACSHACGGAIIGSLWVLSAAHCITQAPALGSYQILVGVLNLDDENPERQLHRVNYAIIHPEYGGLATPLTFSSMIRPISLPDQDEIFEDDAVLSGWGSTSGTIIPEMPNTLQFVEVPIIVPKTCKQALDAIIGDAPNPLDLKANICTGPLTGGVAICSGDSGGPLADLRGETLIGIATWTANPCGRPGAPSVYNRVSYYTRWIRNSISV
ncbi:prostasin-like isoform X2 [Anoplophora glabripennis]|uniref:prostasin-like isoform X2 n=1 Tax=Anoplophora glabripennis TaxID=217634 RepID=UPI00087466FB|nr:prostasin-like isoform X2 [Anoplophora glabripennis]